MGKRGDISPRKVAEIKTQLLHSGYSQRKIAEIAAVSQSTVKNIKRKLTENVSLTPQRTGKCGRKRITTPRAERKLKQITVENRRKPRKMINALLEDAGVSISDRTLRRRLKEMSFTCRRPLKKPKLTPSMMSKRLAFAKTYRDWTEKDWEKVFWSTKLLAWPFGTLCFSSQVCFSDESSIQILQDCTQFVRRRPDEKFHKDCIVERVKHPLSVMIWGVISCKGNGRLHIVKGTMRQDQYLQVLQERLLRQAKDWFGNQEFVFMHDSAPCHKAKKVTKFLQDNKISVLDWPGNSPDLNPIENVWAALKKEIAKEKIITNKTELIAKIIKAWHNTPALSEISKNCIKSMPCRLKEVIARKGGITKYWPNFLTFQNFMK